MRLFLPRDSHSSIAKVSWLGIISSTTAAAAAAASYLDYALIAWVTPSNVLRQAWSVFVGGIPPLRLQP